jgi:hypothetical protein
MIYKQLPSYNFNFIKHNITHKLCDNLAINLPCIIVYMLKRLQKYTIK